MKELFGKVGEIGQDNLIARPYPPCDVTGVVLRAVTKEGVLARGTVLAKSRKDGKCVVLGTPAAEGEVLKAAYVLCDDTEVGKADVAAVAYRRGCFNAAALVVADKYKMTEEDKDDLRAFGVFLHENMVM